MTPPVTARQVSGAENVGLAYARVAELLQEAAGLDVGRFKRPAVLRRVLLRMRLRGLTDLLDYAQLLAREPAEVAALVRELLVPHTPIFRDPEVFSSVVATLPGILRQSPRPQVWVSACGQGEEVYSLAMLVAEAVSAGDAREDFWIFGADVDAEVLERARTGLFNAEAALRLPAEYRARYLVQEGDGYRVVPEIARHCIFLQHDVLSIPSLGGLDLISCRNVLRYLDIGAQRRVLENLHAALRPAGLLLIGSGESALLQPDLFSMQPMSPGLHLRVDQASVAAPVAAAEGRQQAGSFFRGAFALSALPMALLGGDYRVLSINPALAEFLPGGEEHGGQPLTALLDSADQARVLNVLNGLLEDERRTLDVSLKGRSGLVAARLCLTRPAGEVPGFVAEIHLDAATEQTRQQLIQLANRISIGFELMREGVIATDARGKIVEFNEQAARITGWSRGEAIGQLHERIFRVVAPDGSPENSPLHLCLREQCRVESPPGQTLLLARDGRRLNVHCAAAPLPSASGGMDGALLVFEDCTRFSLLSEELAYRSSHDPLTGLLNRDEFERRVNAALAEARGGGARHLLCYIDLDQFKVVNDTHGHFAGDELLRQIAGVFRACLRPEDALARLGGDEFGILLGGRSLEQGRPVFEAVLESARVNRFVWEGQSYGTTVSMGVVPLTAHTLNSVRALAEADAACFAAKDAGRDRVRIANADDEAVKRHNQMSLVSKISRALDHNLFTLHYEDVVKTSAPGEVVYRELLVRMKGDSGELLPAAEFIAAAERYSLMTALDRWVVQAAMLGIAKLGSDGVIYAINVSGLSLSDDKFLNYVISRFDTFGVAPEQVCFEITETAAISHMVGARHFIEKLSDIGCRFALDDFGSGMASFSYLRNLPVHFIKIDGSFVRSMLGNSLDHGMVETINRLGHEMGLRTIAEHVQDLALLEPLRAIGVDWVQGHAIAKSRPFEGLFRQ